MNNTPIKNMSLYAVSLFLMKGVSLFTLPLMAHYLTPTQLGQLEFIGVTTVFFAMVVGLAMHENLYRFIGTIESKSQRRLKAAQLYSASLVISATLGILAFVVYNLLDTPIDAISRAQSLLIAMVLCYEAPLAIGLAWLRLHNQAVLFFKICVCSVTIQVILVLLALIYRPDVTLIFAANVLCTLGQFIFLHFYLGFRIQLPKFSQFKVYLLYSSPLMLSAMVAFCLSGAERWIIAGYTSLETLGIYAIAAKFALGVGILIQPFHMWWMPKRFQVQETQGNRKVVHTIQHGTLLLCMIAVGTAWASQLFITFALPSIYHAAVQMVTMTVLIMMFKELAEIVNMGILYAKQTSKLLFINLASIAFAFIIGALNLHLGIMAILSALLLGQICRFFLALMTSQSLLRLPYNMAAFTGLILLTSLLILSGTVQHSDNVTLLMLVLQPLAILCFAHRTQLINIKEIKAQLLPTHTVISASTKQDVEEKHYG
ncbi:lipopolysaccharide biosynthesis protein [Vibrio atypicus]|uniref:lipopolysaccharide biosynthesis protein n=1 Tax=Vibrio atypicus TaxID=558271 RepID=UPI001357C73D|nr:oligosaccharide flippase family protein [Vibrio atypicus]